jgi:hypothetical protein
MAEESSGSDNVLNQATAGFSESNEDKNSQGSYTSPVENRSSEEDGNGGRTSEKGSTSSGALGDSQPIQGDEEEEEEERGSDSDEDSGEPLEYPGFVPKIFYYLNQTDHPRDWCLKTITWPYPFLKNNLGLKKAVVLVTLYQPFFLFAKIPVQFHCFLF